jgi:hypothetical protein
MKFSGNPIGHWVLVALQVILEARVGTGNLEIMR